MFRANSTLREVENLEAEWAALIGVRYAVCMSGGTPALISALVGLEIGPGDEVIVPGYTFMASALAVLAVGAIPVIAEVDETLSLDPEDVERKVGPYTRAVMPVHMVGRPANLAGILTAAKANGMKVVEDACQADGGSYRGRRLGSWGDVGAFSFNYYKIITAGEGGAVVTNDRTVAERAMIHHDGGIAFRDSAAGLAAPIFIGQQYRMSEIVGAVLRVQLRRLDGILADLRRCSRELAARVAPRPGCGSSPRTTPRANALRRSISGSTPRRRHARSPRLPTWAAAFRSTRASTCTRTGRPSSSIAVPTTPRWIPSDCPPTRACGWTMLPTCARAPSTS